jgi:adenylosuccinate synthase
LENLSVVGLQWGDEGKGKIVDYLAEDYEAVVRFNGGSNAGHTVVVGGDKYVFHLLPSAALNSRKLMIAAGVAVDPQVLSEEVETIRRIGSNTVLVDRRATLVSPLEKMLDALLEDMRGGSALGTTKRGVGPAYAMRALRLAPRVSDLLSDDFDLSPLRNFYSILSDDLPDLGRWLDESRSVLGNLVGDVSQELEAINDAGGSVLFEGSQGALLDLLHGTYPFVTSSGTTSGYIPMSAGIPPGRVGRVLGVMKCYTTRVGSGPFPTELGEDKASEIREKGREFGATTGRPRRVGWLDLVSLSYAIRLNGVKELAVSKLDILTRIKEFRVCEAYSLDGEQTEDFSRCIGSLDRVSPIYSGGWNVEPEFRPGALSSSARKFVEFLEERLHTDITLVSYGEDRSMTYER